MTITNNGKVDNKEDINTNLLFFDFLFEFSDQYLVFRLDKVGGSPVQ